MILSGQTTNSDLIIDQSKKINPISIAKQIFNIITNGKINLNFFQYLELEKLGTKVFSPVINFMNKQEFISVVNKMRFKKIFPLPIILDVKNYKYKKLKK